VAVELDDEFDDEPRITCCLIKRQRKLGESSLLIDRLTAMVLGGALRDRLKRNLRKLAAGHVFFELNERQSGLWDSFSTRNIGLAVQRRMAEAFDGDAKRMRSATASAMAEALGTRLRGWNELELRAFENISLVLAMAPDVRKWSKQERRAALDVIRAKASADEVTYLRLMQRHLPMRDAFLRVGSNDPTGKAATA